MIIGVTGKSGAGKTTFCEELAKNLHAIHVDVDKYCHSAIDKKQTDVERLAGLLRGHVSNTDYRREVGELIFSDREKYKELIEIIWKEACFEIDKILFSEDLVILDHILLPFTHYWNQCNRKILVTCNQNDRYSRILNRDSISLEYLYKRESASPNYTDIVFDVIKENK